MQLGWLKWRLSRRISIEHTHSYRCQRTWAFIGQRQYSCGSTGTERDSHVSLQANVPSFDMMQRIETHSDRFGDDQTK